MSYGKKALFNGKIEEKERQISGFIYNRNTSAGSYFDRRYLSIPVNA